MYAFIEGQVCEKTSHELIIMAGGVGYRLNCSMTTLQAAPAAGETMRCYTELSVREDAMELFGFATTQERELYRSLITISGIGPRIALGMLGSMPLKELVTAILLGDITVLSRAPGIGKKTAQRIALELKGKLGAEDLTLPADGPSAAAPITGGIGEALEALIALGYTQQEARSALNRVKDQAQQTDDLIRLALRHMAGM